MLLITIRTKSELRFIDKEHTFFVCATRCNPNVLFHLKIHKSSAWLRRNVSTRIKFHLKRTELLFTPVAMVA